MLKNSKTTRKVELTLISRQELMRVINMIYQNKLFQGKMQKIWKEQESKSVQSLTQ